MEKRRHWYRNNESSTHSTPGRAQCSMEDRKGAVAHQCTVMLSGSLVAQELRARLLRLSQSLQGAAAPVLGHIQLAPLRRLALCLRRLCLIITNMMSTQRASLI